jgi:hypothetical protein
MRGIEKRLFIMDHVLPHRQQQMQMWNDPVILWSKNMCYTFCDIKAEVYDFKLWHKCRKKSWQVYLKSF